MILLDTNLLGRLTDSTDPQYAVARKAVHVLFAQRERLVVVPQILYEFWAIATRPVGRRPAGQNGLGMTCDQANLWLNFFRRRFTVLPDRPNLLETWQDLVKAHGITGFKSHHARIVAAMQTYGISRLLTFNANDFKTFSIEIVDSSTLVP